MRVDLLADLRRTMRGEHSIVTPENGVINSNGYTRKPKELRQLRPLRSERDERESEKDEGVKRAARAPLDSAEIEERAGLASDRVPATYLDAWARLNQRKPMNVSEVEWRLALDDGGQFLDVWGADAAGMEWTPDELFKVPSGLAWRLAGAHVEAIEADHMRLSNGRTIARNKTVKRLESGGRELKPMLKIQRGRGSEAKPVQSR
jgi:hypothetical protein